MRLLIGLFLLSTLFSEIDQDNTYKVGQVWEYQTRKGEEKSTLTIVAVQNHQKLGTIINIYVGKLKIKNPNTESGLSTEIQHMPFSKEFIDKSVTKLITTAKQLPNHKEGYDEWKTAFDKGEAGIFTITVKESIDAMEKALNQ